MIFVDTSAIYAVLDRDDRHHDRARECWLGILKSGAPMFTTNYVVVEICALAQHHLGLDALRTIQEDILPMIDVRWIDEASHNMAMAMLLAARRKKLSLVDCASFVAMRQSGEKIAFAFDRHFTEEGFLFPS